MTTQERLLAAVIIWLGLLLTISLTAALGALGLYAARQLWRLRTPPVAVRDGVLIH